MGKKMKEGVKILIPKNVQKIIDILNNYRYSAYIVGGCVRDSLLGIEPKDWDITTNATPKDMNEIKKDFQDIDIIPTGEQYGTMSWKLTDDKQLYEVTTFRGESGYSDGRRPDTVKFEDSIEEDLSRRDFTINAMAYNNDVGLIDLYNGKNDLLYSKKLETVGDANKRFQEDSLRILRGVRFATKYKLHLDKDTYEAMLDNLELIKNVSKERIREELIQILSYKVSETFRYIIEDIFEINHCYNGDMSIQDNMKCLDTNINWKNKVAIILDSKKELYKAEEWLRKYKFSNNEVKTILNLLKLFKGKKEEYSDYDLRCLLSKYPLEDIKLFFEDNEDILGRLAEQNLRPTNITDLEINGNVLLELGYKGETIGKILNSCLEKVLQEPSMNTRELLLEYIKDIKL